VYQVSNASSLLRAPILLPIMELDYAARGANDLDLDAALDESVTVVEWGEGLVEGLAADRLDVRIERPTDDGDETRTVEINGIGTRWDADQPA